MLRNIRETSQTIHPGDQWRLVEGHEPALMHEAMAATLDTAVEQIKQIQQDARAHGNLARPRWPMIVLNSPKGWTGPKMVDDLQVEGTFRSHQDPGFIDHVVNKKAEVVRVYLPPDANCLLSVMDHCLRSRHYVNVVIAGKHPAPQWLTMEAAVKHCTEGTSAFGSGPVTTRVLHPMWSWAAAATCPRRRRSPPSPLCASICPI